MPDGATAKLPAPPQLAPPEAKLQTGTTLLLCGLAWSASLIHVQAAIDHLSESGLYALLFIELAAAQLAWGVLLYRLPQHRRLLVAGAIASLAVLGVWLLSRVSGLPVGPDRAGPESLGLLDTVASADEIGLVLLAALRLRPPRNAVTAQRGMQLIQAVALCLILASCLALAGGTHAH